MVWYRTNGMRSMFCNHVFHIRPLHSFNLSFTRNDIKLIFRRMCASVWSFFSNTFVVYARSLKNWFKSLLNSRSPRTIAQKWLSQKKKPFDFISFEFQVVRFFFLCAFDAKSIDSLWNDRTSQEWATTKAAEIDMIIKVIMAISSFRPKITQPTIFVKNQILIDKWNYYWKQINIQWIEWGFFHFLKYWLV